MRITLLGSGTAIPDPERGAPGIAVQEAGSLLFLDCGAGSLSRASRFGIPVEEVDGVFFSHLHPDHTADLVPLLFAFRNQELVREKDLVILGPEGIERFLQDLEGVYGDWIRPAGYRLRIQPLHGDGPVTLGPWVLRTFPVPHGPAALACSVTGADGRRLVYSGDTGYAAEMASFARGADLLVLECSFPEGPPHPGHLIPSEAGRMARESGCGRLLLTHFYPACRGEDLLTPCQGVYDGSVVLGEDGLSLDV